MGNSKRILIVDDEQDIRTYLSTLLEDHCACRCGQGLAGDRHPPATVEGRLERAVGAEPHWERGEGRGLVLVVGLRHGIFLLRVGHFVS